MEITSYNLECMRFACLILLLTACDCVSTFNPAVGTLIASPKQAQEQHAEIEIPGPTPDPNWVPRVVVSGKVTSAVADDIEAVFDQIDELHERHERVPDAVLLEINSSGGDVGAGVRIGKAIEESPVKVVCLVDGEADSMAFWMLQSCDIRGMTKRSVLMAHQPAFTAMFIQGQENIWRNKAEALRVMNRVMAEHCSRKMTVSAATFEAKITGGLEWWFHWQDALDYHAVDFVADRVGPVIYAYRNYKIDAEPAVIRALPARPAADAGQGTPDAGVR